MREARCMLGMSCGRACSLGTIRDAREELTRFLLLRIRNDVLDFPPILTRHTRDPRHRIQPRFTVCHFGYDGVEAIALVGGHDFTGNASILPSSVTVQPAARRAATARATSLSRPSFAS